MFNVYGHMVKFGGEDRLLNERPMTAFAARAFADRMFRLGYTTRTVRVRGKDRVAPASTACTDIFGTTHRDHEVWHPMDATCKRCGATLR